jgi:hypothetical protein
VISVGQRRALRMECPAGIQDLAGEALPLHEVDRAS